ncbi:MAG TPA: hypothetical protein VKA80_10730 [Beijerinckiaceae bacterium]|nr:hypothetical protein [Beijerinckiaceae bacterium]
MRKPLNRAMRKAFAALPRFQVAVSIVATLSAGFLAQLVLKSDPAPQPATTAAARPLMLDPDISAGLLRAHFTETGYRLRPGYPTEFAAVFGPAPGKPYRELIAADWSPTAAAPRAAKGDDRPAAAQSCGEACKRNVMTAAVLPPPRPASLAIPTPDPPPAIVAAAPEERARLLGMRLPGFVPSGEKVVKTVVSWGGAVSGLIDGVR